MLLRLVCIITGIALIAGTAHATIDATGGYGTPQSFITIAVAAGVGVGSLAIGAALAEGRIALAVAIGIALLAGEAFALLGTAERLLERREASQAPVRAAMEARAAAEHRMREAERALRDVPTSSPRLKAAEVAKVEADRAAIDKAAEKGCAANCRALLEQQVTAAATDVANAREALDAARKAAERELSDARVAFARATVPPSGSPLADRLGWQPWMIDLLMAALGSLAANGLAGTLLAFAAHKRHPKPERANRAEKPTRHDEPIDITPVNDQEPVKSRPLVELAAQFGVERLIKADDGVVPLPHLFTEYRDWCVANGLEVAPVADIAKTFVDLFKTAQLRVVEAGGQPAVAGITIKPRTIAA